MYVVKPYLIAVVEEREFYRRRNITDVSVNVGLARSYQSEEFILTLHTQEIS